MFTTGKYLLNELHTAVLLWGGSVECSPTETNLITTKMIIIKFLERGGHPLS